MKQFHSLKQFKTVKHCATIGETIYHNYAETNFQTFALLFHSDVPSAAK